MRINQKNYARALAEVGQEMGVSESLLQELGQVASTFKEAPPVASFLNDSHVEFGARQDALAKAFPRLGNQAKNFIFVLMKNNRLDQLGNIIEETRRIIDENSNTLEVVAVSAAPVSDSVNKKIAVALENKTGRQIRVKNETDESLIGGLIIKINDLVIDASIRGKIQRLKNKIRQLN